MYSKEVMNEFMNPKNVGVIKDADAIGKVGNMVCGDVMYIYLKIAKNSKKEDYIKDIKFQTLGCGAAIATSSKITQLAMGKTLKSALNITKNDIASGFNLPPIKLHCSVLADDALKEAIYDFYKKTNQKIPKDLEDNHKKVIEELYEAENKGVHKH